jgi:hypothetical protein
MRRILYFQGAKRPETIQDFGFEFSTAVLAGISRLFCRGLGTLDGKMGGFSRNWMEAK